MMPISWAAWRPAQISITMGMVRLIGSACGLPSGRRVAETAARHRSVPWSELFAQVFADVRTSGRGGTLFGNFAGFIVGACTALCFARVSRRTYARRGGAQAGHAAWYDGNRGSTLGDIIRKKKNGRFLGYYIRWVDLDGKRKQPASHQPSYALAKRMLVEIEARVARGHAGLVNRKPAQAACFRPVRALACGVWQSAHQRPGVVSGDCSDGAAALAAHHRSPRRDGAWPQRHRKKARDLLSQKYRPNTVRATLRPFGTCLSWAVRQG